MTDKPTVLIVDDDPHLVAGLRRMLMRSRQWTISTASGGAEALEILEREPVSVLLSDMQMPGMDGPELLTLVRQAHPRVARIVLSGESDRDASMRALRVAHRFLSKPTDPADLIDAISRACNLRGRFLDLEMSDALGAVERLPSPPAVLQRINEVIADPNAEMREVGAIIEADAGLAVKLLQTVNSAFFGLPQRLTSVSAAAAYLGLSTVQAIVTMASLDDAAQRLPSARTGEFNARAQRVTHLLQGLVPRHQQAEAQAIGLVHDIGWLALAAARPDRMDEVGAAMGDGQDPDVSTLPPHADVGAYMLDLWGLPEGMVEAVALHHGACAQSVSPMAHALQLAVALHEEERGMDAHPCLQRDHLQGCGMAQHVDDVRVELVEAGCRG